MPVQKKTIAKSTEKRGGKDAEGLKDMLNGGDTKAITAI